MSGAIRPELASLPSQFDVAVIGGGITGAGIFSAAAARGLRTLLVERGDFASGTSSWSSKLVHGGLRYLKSGQWGLTLKSVRERNRLRREHAGLVEPLQFLMPVYAGQSPGLAAMRAGLFVYDLMAGSQRSRLHGAAAALAAEPLLRSEGLRGAVSYVDAQTDDARLTLRLILDAQSDTAFALNYCEAQEVLTAKGRVRGLRLRDGQTGVEREIEARCVIDATGVDAGRLQGAPAGAPSLRPLRGSHLVFPLAVLPVNCAVSWLHPRDNRPIFVYPWEGVALYGTTDVDHAPGTPPRASREEIDYLMEGLASVFAGRAPPLAAAIAATSGVRPLVAGGKADPSAESRESAIWTAPGWVGAAGGKLTTFRITAREVLAAAGFPDRRQSAAPRRAAGSGGRRSARYGEAFAQAGGVPGDATIPGTLYAFAELAWSARHEAVVHLDDLLMRRLRLSLLLGRGVAPHWPRIEAICREALRWDAARWAAERARYESLWTSLHALPS